MKVVTTAQMRQIEKEADAAGHSYADMMESAGRAVAQAVRAALAKDRRRVLLLVGPGNNGGDALVAARYLHEWHYECTLYIWKRSTDIDTNYDRTQELGIVTVWSQEDTDFAQLTILARESDAIVDGLLGTGTTGALRGNLGDMLSRLASALARPASDDPPLTPLVPPASAGAFTRTRAIVVAVDGPSGLDFDSGHIDERALYADLSVTFGYPKPGLFALPGAAHVGELTVADIGLDPALAADISLTVATPDAVAHMLPPRPLDAHKGTFGTALVVGGSANYVGAPCLAAKAAYRVGAGLVTLGIAGSLQSAMSPQAPEATFLLLPHDLGSLVEEAARVIGTSAKVDALLIGPGLGQEKGTAAFVQALCGAQPPRRKAVGFGAHSETPPEYALAPMVIDADALNLLSQSPDWWKHLRVPAVITPHPGEMARLTKLPVTEVQADRVGTARRYAQEWGVDVLLKGAYSVVASPKGDVTIIPMAHPILATAGTGDVLAGAVVGLMAQGLAPYEAAICGAYLHAMAGLRLSNEMGDAGMLAGDLLPALPRVLWSLRTR